MSDCEDPKVPPDSSASELDLDQHERVNHATSSENVWKSLEAARSADTFCDAQFVTVPMRRPMTKTARVYKTEMLIRNRGHVSFQASLNELEVSLATLKRDLDYLKDQLGAPIEYDPFLNG